MQKSARAAAAVLEASRKRDTDFDYRRAGSEGRQGAWNTSVRRVILRPEEHVGSGLKDYD